jgi:mycofactocin biosynthetic radical S-adenosylmethionine protein MftC
VVCLIDPVGDVYACPFTIHEEFLAGNVREPGGFAQVWRESALFASLRRPQSGGACESCSAYGSCRGGCMAAKFFTGLPLDGPDPECVKGHGEPALAGSGAVSAPRPSGDHSRRPPPVPVSISRRPPAEPGGGHLAAGPGVSGRRPPAHACDEHPLAGSGLADR